MVLLFAPLPTAHPWCQVLTQLSSEYFALRTRDRALQLVEKRLKRIGNDEESVAREVLGPCWVARCWSISKQWKLGYRIFRETPMAGNELEAIWNASMFHR